MSYDLASGDKVSHAVAVQFIDRHFATESQKPWYSKAEQRFWMIVSAVFELYHKQASATSGGHGDLHGRRYEI